MRSELEKIGKIELYIKGGLTKDEKIEFEQELNQNESLKEEVEQYRLIIDRLKVVGLKKRIKIAHQKYSTGSGLSWVTKLIISISIIILVSLALFISEVIDLTDNSSVTIELVGINPPISQADVPFESRLITTNKPHVLNYESGSIVIIPSDAFVDSLGLSIEGEVKIEFREFNDAIDLYLSGIPMDFTINGQKYPFESAAMCEIQASKSGQEVYLKKGTNIEIIQNSYTSSEVFNLYRFDKTTNNWVEKGKDNVFVDKEDPLELKSGIIEEYVEPALSDTSEVFDIAVDVSELESPFTADNKRDIIQPKKANSNRLNFHIAYDVKEFPELEGFKNVSFEIDPERSNFKKGDNEIEWENVEILQGSTQETYKVRFSKPTENIQRIYTVRPVFEKEYYQEAVNVYQKRLANYRKALSKRTNVERKEREEIEEYNRVILRRNRQIDSINRVIQNRSIVQASSTSMSLQESTKLNNEIRALNLMFKRRWLFVSPFVSEQVKEKLVFRNSTAQMIYDQRDFIEENYIKMRRYIRLDSKRNFLLNDQSVDDSLKNQLRATLKQTELREFLANKEALIESAFENQIEKLNSINQIRRSFAIDRFGIWNTDTPVRIPDGISINATFKYREESIKEVVTIIDKNRRMLLPYAYKNYNRFKFSPSSQKVVFTIKDGNILYSKDFPNDAVQGSKHEFPMHLLEVDNKNYAEVKKALMEL